MMWVIDAIWNYKKRMSQVSMLLTTVQKQTDVIIATGNVMDRYSNELEELDTSLKIHREMLAKIAHLLDEGHAYEARAIVGRLMGEIYAQNGEAKIKEVPHD